MLNNLVLDSESLNGVLEGKTIPQEDIINIYKKAQNDPAELFAVARELRRRYKRDTVTFSKKAFLNIVNLCRDTCSYCTYKSEPSQEKLSLMSRQQIRDVLKLAKKYKCVEALLVTGERPEQKYPEATEWLHQNGFETTAEYLVYASEMAIEEGLFPHTNAGNLEYDEMRDLKRTNVSMGAMLESSSDRLTEKGMPHHMAASKKPKARIATLENAGRLGIPMTTGILIGIGETIQEIIDSLITIRQLDKKYENIQEVIIQNFQPKQDTPMKSILPAEKNYFKVIVALARIIMPKMNIQIPPNLSPDSYQDFLQLGINDWGGISPLTPDFVNPEFSWPEINQIEKYSRMAGFQLECRFPVYPEFFSSVSKNLRDKMRAIGNKDLVREDYWQKT